MRGIEGNFMAQPRVFAHSAQPVILGSDISDTDQRGCALYVGTTGTIVVRMEGTHKAEDVVGNLYDTNVSIFYNVPGGSFLPILVTSVLESNQVELTARADFYDLEFKKAEDLLSQLQEELTELRNALAQAEQEADEAKDQASNICEKLGEDSGPCRVSLQKADRTLETVKQLKNEEVDLEARVEDQSKETALAEKEADIARSASEDPALLVTTDAENILALF